MARFYTYSISKLCEVINQSDTQKRAEEAERLNLKCYQDEMLLYESSVDRLKINNDIDDTRLNRVLASIDRAGARMPYRCELYPSVESQSSESQDELGYQFNDMSKPVTNRSVKTFSEWFLKSVRNRPIVPDTSIILNHYLSNVILPRLNSTSLQILIPRTVILELEARGNRKNGEKKRLSFSAFNEIRRLRSEIDAMSFPYSLDADLLRNFSQIAGRQNVDSFIRREIHDAIKTPRSRSSIGARRLGELVFTTRDMMLACAASAEDIDTFYFAPANSEKTLFDINEEELAKIILETSIDFGTIRIEGIFDKSILCDGMWSGKRMLQWFGEQIRVTFQDS